MLTWKSGSGMIFDVNTFKHKRTFQYETTRNEGWGITHDGKQLIVSDGSAFLHFWVRQYKHKNKLYILLGKMGEGRSIITCINKSCHPAPSTPSTPSHFYSRPSYPIATWQQDPVTLEETRKVKVQMNGKDVDEINELEYIPGDDVVLANIWY